MVRTQFMIVSCPAGLDFASVFVSGSHSFFLLDLFSVPKKFLSVSWWCLPFCENYYSQSGYEQTHVIYLGLKKIDIKVKWGFCPC